MSNFASRIPATLLRPPVLRILATLRWLLVIVPMAMAVGAVCAGFLHGLRFVTETRFAHPWLLYLLPLGGLAVGLLYRYFGGAAEGGTNLIMDEIHDPGGGVPRRMAPLVLLGTLATHLFGGSAGREGTAVQVGGSMSAAVCGLLRLGPELTRVVLMGGVAAGFGAVFGTPLAGAVFAMEVLAVGRIGYGALLPCLIAAVVADWTCHACGAEHTQYAISYLASARPPAAFFHLEIALFLKVALASVFFGLAGTLFARLTHRLGAVFKRIAWPPLRPAAGGVVVIALVSLAGTTDYLGLGVWSRDPHAVTISSLLASPDIHPWSWLWKLVFTAVTLGAGFKGGEVTPLFFVGAALGNVLSGVFGAPPDLFAALGFAAVFAAATNTPLACMLMAIELFGATHGVYFATACFVAYLSSSHDGIYRSQRIAERKHPASPAR